MKKKRTQGKSFLFDDLPKIYRIMRLICLFLFAALLQVSASSYSQTTKLNLNGKNLSLERVFELIEDQSEFSFIYNLKQVDLSKKVDVDFKNKQVEKILDSVLEGTDITYTVDNRLIVIHQEGTPNISFVIGSQQLETVSGKVTDSSGQPLPGVTVVVKGTTQGTVTNADGEYSLANIPGDAILQFSFVGMRTQEIVVGGQTVIDLTMEEDAIGIEEVVAIGYGTMKKSELTSSIAKINSEDLEVRPVARVDQALQGQMAGVYVQQSGSKPGKNANIRVRGVGSITAGTDPLYVIDGFPVDAETFANLNLSNIESIEVLKDAASAAIYGSRGSNGVVIVTTTRGEKGQELKMHLNIYSGISNIERRVEMLNAKEQMELIADEKDGKWIESGGSLDVLPLDRPYNYRYDQNLLNDPDLPSYDHLGAILQTGTTQNYTLSASGSTKNVRYFFSGEYYNQTGIIKNTDYIRYSARANIDADINSFLTIGLSLTPMRIISHDKDTEMKEGIVHHALLSSPILPPRLGYWGESDVYSTFSLANRSPENLAIIEHLKDEQVRNQILMDVYAHIEILPGLSLKNNFGAKVINVRRDMFKNQIIMRNQTPEGEYWGNESLNWLNENILSFNKVLKEKHKVDGLLGFTAQKQENKSAYIKGTGFANDYVPTLNAATEYVANTSMSEWSLLSYLGRVNYSFSDKYLFQASIRRDGSSRFGKNTKWGWFPSISGAWRIEQEDFIKQYQTINRLKLRVSWGKTGNNDIGNYSAIANMGNSYYLFGTSEMLTPGMKPNSISNPNLSWEKTASLDIGLDLGLVNNRILFAVDYYNKQTNDLLLDVPVPTITGFSTETQNYGKIENKGWDFELSTINIDKELKWSTNFNITFNKNNVLQLGPNDTPIFGGFEDNNITMVGYPIGSYYMYKQIGVYNTQEEIDATPHRSGSQPGDVIIEDYSGPDGVPDGVIDANDRQILGSNIPKYFWGLTSQLSFKNVDLSIFFNGVGGNHIFNTIGRQFDRPQGAHNVKYKHWVNRWRSPEEPGDGMTPRMWGSPTGASSEFTSRMIYPGDYLRLKNITLGYTFPKRITDKINLSALRIYIQGENLYTWDHYDVGFSPEVDMYNGDARAAGNDYGMYPSSRTFLFGINVSF
ncbi:SusC/RagA family TonB-linked outer membrane protein [Maribellus comscasis]|uniref:SusC/RagA family TonB-linked outer membrane protein n=1 Tax=Maribellus comscasis TaxID=2681766 RepID=A0A6I6JN90_9BACT|nr:TonB-dependent receptor [Maribellus comscasis]QGY42569.1 SusC/RagA family TonB-linked outer membrane protein [Maribellus comscasis]